MKLGGEGKGEKEWLLQSLLRHTQTQKIKNIPETD